jgi:hypothetical protein
MRKWHIAIFVAVFGLYMLSSSREPAWGDAHSMWEVADRIVQHGAIDIKTRWPEDLPPGRDGKTYSINPIGVSLVHVPGAGFAALSHSVSPRHDVLVRPIFTHVGPALLGALSCVLFFALLVDLGRTKRTASLCTAILAVATTQWVYARMPYSEILQLTCFLGLFRQTLRTAESPTRREALWLGLWAGCLFNSKYGFSLAIAVRARARLQLPALERRHEDRLRAVSRGVLRRQHLRRCVGHARVAEQERVPLLAAAAARAARLAGCDPRASPPRPRAAPDRGADVPRLLHLSIVER